MDPPATVMPQSQPFNPFPGLRPFEADEDYLFFGREKETDDLLRRLRSHRFLSVVGTSGSGKSSLVRSGLIPSLHSGFMATAGSSWRVALLRPGEDPIGRLAEGLDSPDVLGKPESALASTNRVLLEATLRRSTLGLVDAVRQSHISRQDNVLVLVDQFEELFRFRRKHDVEHSGDDAVAFVRLLLEAAGQNDLPIYVVVTMRSDFIGDCMDFPGLPEAVNDGQYLVPRMTRDELRLAITGPVAVGGATITPRLVQRLLNDAGDDPDQLPLLQHGLMRVWNHWADQGRRDLAIDLVNYEAVGTLAEALSKHAEEAFQEAVDRGHWLITQKIFKALTDTFTDPRGIRRPTSIADLAAICESTEEPVKDVVEIFRRPGRTFLMPPSSVPLTSSTIVDLSHESLMRCWTRLIGWAQEERTAAAIYARLSREATWYEEGAAGLWTDPELEIGLRWRRDNRPTAAWARRYDEAFDRAMRYLDLSEEERNKQRAERRARRLRNLAIAWGSAGVLLVVLLVVSYLARVAARERHLAEQNLQVANDAVNQALAVTDRRPEVIAAEPPETQAFRRELLARAKGFYRVFVNQQPTNPVFLAERADAHSSLGHINRVLGETADAEREYGIAIRQFENLVTSDPQRPAYRESLANAYNYLGETLRPLIGRRTDAANAYGRALDLQTALVKADPSHIAYTQELARTHYNRGILSSAGASAGDQAFTSAEADLRSAVNLLQPIGKPGGDRQVLQDLARAQNNLASLLDQDPQPTHASEAKALYERAIAIHEGLVAKDPRNREYKLELAKFSDNLAYVLGEIGDVNGSTKASSRALSLLDELARPTALLGIERADAHNLRARIVQASQPAIATDDYREALDLYREVERALDSASLTEFHSRFDDFLVNLASLRQEHPADDTVRKLLADAMTFYAARGRTAVSAGSRSEAQTVIDNLSQLLPQLPENDRRNSEGVLKELQAAVDKLATDRK
jgi:hypothetical protein